SGFELTNGRSSVAVSRRPGSTKPTNLSEDSTCSGLNVGAAGILTEPLTPAARRACRWADRDNETTEECPRLTTGTAAEPNLATESGDGRVPTIRRYSADTLPPMSLGACSIGLAAALASARRPP